MTPQQTTTAQRPETRLYRAAIRHEALAADPAHPVHEHRQFLPVNRETQIALQIYM